MSTKHEKIATGCLVVLSLGCAVLWRHNCTSMSEMVAEQDACAHVCLKRGVTSYTISGGECFCVLDGKVVNR